jgi:transposase
MAGVAIALLVRARRLFCGVPTWPRKIFAERFERVAQPRAQLSARLESLAHCLAFTLGGRPVARLADRLAVRISNDTLLRVVRRRKVEDAPPPSVVGIDDWAWRRNYRYGTLICDLERRKTIALSPDREPATAEAWLKRHPQITVVACDRCGGYAIAA